MTLQFSGSLRDFRELTEDKYLKVKKLSALDLFSAVVLETPVDKGVLRNNWFVGLGLSSGETTEQADQSGGGTISRIRSDIELNTVNEDIFLTNNLPYAAPIEFDGHSGKAPDGMVRVNIIRWGEIVERNARNVERE